MQIIDFNFYNRHVVDVAKDLLGKVLVFGDQQGIITETEAYRGSDDEASHAYKGVTKRSAIMFDAPGYAYVYMIYGMYYCLNIVTEEIGNPAAVLIRGLALPNVHLDGPGKICRSLGITTRHNGISLLENHAFHLREGITVDNIITTNRIGIKKAIDKPWRFLFKVENTLSTSISKNQ
jgi:DNA-3-methyladenine glycosylase